MNASREQTQLLRAWIERARLGDRVALDRLGRHYEPLVRAQIGRIMGPRARRWDDSASMTNLVLAEGLRQVPNLPETAGPTELLSRLRRTASSRVIDLVRAHGSHPAPAKWEDAEAEKSTTSALDLVLRHDRQRRLARCVDELPALYAPVVHMRGLRQYPLSQVAAELGRPVDTVRKQYARAVRMLARKIGTRDFD
ncbi:MAG: sigma-70 family RNA polymerase sigma factor [bacterium]|nr:sigma-70 family RNA polymerase sigma factor [bacterium]